MKRFEILKHVYPKKVICRVGINYFIFHSYVLSWYLFSRLTNVVKVYEHIPIIVFI